MKRFFSFLLTCTLLLTATTLSNETILGQSRDEYSLQLQGFAWNHSTLSALVVTPNNASWWNPNYINATLRAIGQWNEANSKFAANYSDFTYLSNLEINWAITNQTRPGFDLYINWTESSLSDSSDEVGLAKTLINGDNSIINCSINLAVQTNHGNALGEVDMQNIALHELGHGLGLGHSNYTDDLMYALYTVAGSPEGISTLDVYGVAKIFAWMPNPTSFRPISNWLTENTVSLPPQITYQDLPVSPQNIPPQTLTNTPAFQFLLMVLNILLRPEIAVPLIVIIILFLIIAFVPTRRKRPLYG